MDDRNMFNRQSTHPIFSSNPSMLTSAPSKNFYDLPITADAARELLDETIKLCRKKKLFQKLSIYVVISLHKKQYEVVIIPKITIDRISISQLDKKSAYLLSKFSFYVLLPKNILGEPGNQGKVILGFNLDTSEKVAIKICDTKCDPSIDEQIKSEQLKLQMLNRFIGECTLHSKSQKLGSEQLKATIMTYYNGVNLRNYLYNIDKKKSPLDPTYFVSKKKINPLTLVDIFLQIIEQTSFIHSQGIIHRDINLKNIVSHRAPGEPTKWYLIDLGDAIFENEKQAYAGTLGYSSPENKCSKKTDFYSLGVLLLEMLLSKANYAQILIQLGAYQTKINEPLELTPDKIHALMPITLSHRNLKSSLPAGFDFVQLVHHFDNIIFCKYLHHSLHKLSLSLTRINSDECLPEGSLFRIYTELKKTYDFCINLSQQMRVLADEIAYVYDEISSNEIDKKKVYTIFLEHLNFLIRNSPYQARTTLMSNAAEFCIILFNKAPKTKLATSEEIRENSNRVVEKICEISSPKGSMNKK